MLCDVDVAVQITYILFGLPLGCKRACPAQKEEKTPNTILGGFKIAKRMGS